MSFLDAVMLFVAVAFLICSKPTKDDKMFFCRDSTAALRGVAMIGIIIHHIHNNLGYSSPILSQMGYLATGLFFFISGYGNMFSINKSKKIGIKWIINKFLKIYVPFSIVYFFYYITDAILYPSEMPTVTETVQDIFTVSLPGLESWFPKIILLCFLLQWLAKKLFSNYKIQCTVIFLALCCYVFCMIKWKLGGGWWYNSVLCYPLGIFFALIKDNLLRIINSKHKSICFFIVTVLMFSFAFVGVRYLNNLRILCSLCFSIMCFSFTLLFRTKTKILAWVGNNSFEFYLVHLLFLKVFFILIPINNYLYSILVIAGTLLFVFIYLYVKVKITKKYNSYIIRRVHL
ncbi:MAG: acyltransferase family protein [Ruminococcus sp.]